MERLIGYVKGHEEIKEIPKSHRYIGRPALGNLFKEEGFRDKEERDKKIKEAVEKYGYSQKEVADYLEIHYSTVSRAVNEEDD